MRIVSIASNAETIPLTRPYAIAPGVSDSAEIVFLKLATSTGLAGFGAASPGPRVTGETAAAARSALSHGSLEWLIGADIRELPRLTREAEGRLAGLPAARAALDMALHDLLSRQLGVPLVEMLGRAHPELPTSITIGIRDTAASLAEADEYLARGFRVLKVKIGRSLEEDLERLGRIRERVGRSVRIRADANEGYTVEETRRFLDASETLDLELLEQPVPRREFAGLVALPERVRARIAADESLHDERDALDLAAARACGIFNIKLMKCGGIRPALRIAAIAETAGISLMWGCMDESVISISAALHAAFASPATRYLDLDGSLDLSRDLAEGGFTIEQGQMRTLDLPGLGIRPV